MAKRAVTYIFTVSTFRLSALGTKSHVSTFAGAKETCTNVARLKDITSGAKSLGAIATVTNSHLAATLSAVVPTTSTALCRW